MNDTPRPLIVSATSTLGAGVSLDANGNVSYDPTGSSALQALSDGETVTDTFTYVATDGQADSNTATVTVTITGANDVIIGTEGPDTLIGTGGIDSIFGLGGDDFLDGGANNDALIGGDGTDTAIFSGVMADYTISSGADGALVVTDTAPGTAGDDGLADRAMAPAPLTRQSGLRDSMSCWGVCWS